MRSAVAALACSPSLADDMPAGEVGRIVRLADALPVRATDEEALALLALVSRSDDIFYEVTWTIVHFIETAPGWPIWPILLHTQGEWARTLETRSRNAGLVPPQGARERA